MCEIIWAAATGLTVAFAGLLYIFSWIPSREDVLIWFGRIATLLFLLVVFLLANDPTAPKRTFQDSELIKANVAYYEMNPTTGETVIKLKTNSTTP